MHLTKAKQNRLNIIVKQHNQTKHCTQVNQTGALHFKTSKLSRLNSSATIDKEVFRREELVFQKSL
jgi:hypothetical protein